MITHSSILAWKIPWAEHSGRLQFMGSQESDTTEPHKCYSATYTLRESSVQFSRSVVSDSL